MNLGFALAPGQVPRQKTSEQPCEPTWADLHRAHIRDTFGAHRAVWAGGDHLFMVCDCGARLLITKWDV